MKCWSFFKYLHYHKKIRYIHKINNWKSDRLSTDLHKVRLEFRVIHISVEWHSDSIVCIDGWWHVFVCSAVWKIRGHGSHFNLEPLLELIYYIYIQVLRLCKRFLWTISNDGMYLFALQSEHFTVRDNILPWKPWRYSD